MPIKAHRHRLAMIVLLALLVCMGLVACGDASSSAPTGTATAASGGPAPRTATPVKAARLNMPASNERLAQFAACLRRNGVKALAPDAIDASSAHRRAAEAKCRRGLHRAIFRPLEPPETPSSGARHSAG
jgi:hypothetical protein